MDVFKRQVIVLQNTIYAVKIETEKRSVYIVQEEDIILMHGDTELVLIISVQQGNYPLQRIILNVNGGFYLHTNNDMSNCQSVKLEEMNLYLSLNTQFLCIDIAHFVLKWQVEPDLYSIFEFYDLENDFLLRGELAMHRISKEGKILWSFGGKDIFVNIDGQEEVKIIGNTIFLTDFLNNKYQIGFDGKYR